MGGFLRTGGNLFHILDIPTAVVLPRVSESQGIIYFPGKEIVPAGFTRPQRCTDTF
jgi:hypothetical protein